MKITLTSVMVDDQDKALRFYTEILGFVKKAEVPLGDYSWLTVTSPDQPDGPELLLEPDRAPGGQALQGRPGRGRHPVHVVRASPTFRRSTTD